MLGLSALGACTDEEPSLRESGSSVTTLNKIAGNKLAGNKIAGNKLAGNKLAGNKLAGNKLAINMAGAADLMTTADGREVLTYIVSCALPEGVTLTGENAGVTYEFFGELGLAPSWTDHPLKRAGRGWVSACLFSRVNLYDVALPISLRGPTAALSTTADERASWSVEEGAFYGEFFTPDNEPINWIACRGEGQASGELGELVNRDCTEPDPADPTRTLCGFHYAGDCGDFAPVHACKTFSTTGTFYDKCSGTVDADDDADDDDDDDDHGHGHDHRGHDHQHHAPMYRQIITTYVTPS